MKIIDCDWLKTDLALFDDINELVEESGDKSLGEELCNGMGGKFEKEGMSYFFVYVKGTEAYFAEWLFNEAVDFYIPKQDGVE